MKVIDLKLRVKRLAAIGLAAATVALVAGSLAPAGAATPLAPVTAEAFQGGWDRDHWWIKVPRAEVFQGLVSVACMRFAGFSVGSRVCPVLSNVAKQGIRGGWGFWAEIYPPRWQWFRGGIGRWTAIRTRVGFW